MLCIYPTLIRTWNKVLNLLGKLFKEVMSWSRVDALSVAFFVPFDSAFIAAMASGLFLQNNIGHSNNYGPNGPNKKNGI